jgi:hypothetical protein
MTRPITFVAVAVLAYIVSAGTTKLAGQDYLAAVVVCAPCDGAEFGLANGRGMVLMQQQGSSVHLSFYPLDESAIKTVTSRGFPPVSLRQTEAIEIGSMPAIGSPLTWAKSLGR